MSIRTGEETNIQVQKIFIYDKPYPYTECRDRDTFNSEFVSFITKNLNKSYFQSDCFDLCRQKFIINKCNCYYAKYPIIITASVCLNETQFKCIKMSLNEFINKNELNCVDECPHECDSVEYHLTISTSDYPNRQYYEYLIKNQNIFNTLVSSFYNNTNTTTSISYDSFKKTSLALNVFLPYMEYTEVTQSPKFNGFDLLAQIGGALGVLLSMSIFTCIEFFEIAALSLYSLFFNPKKN